MPIIFSFVVAGGAPACADCRHGSSQRRRGSALQKSPSIHIYHLVSLPFPKPVPHLCDPMTNRSGQGLIQDYAQAASWLRKAQGKAIHPRYFNA